MVSRSSSWRCLSCSRATLTVAFSSLVRACQALRSISIRLGACLSTSSGATKGSPVASAFRRADLASSDRYSALFSPSEEAKRVESILSRIWPASTSWPGFTRISSTMPPSRLWMICTWREGTTLPSPRTTSSMLPKPAHSNSRGNGQQAGPQQHAGAARLRFVDDPFGVADVVVALLRLALSAPSSRRSKPYTKTLRSLSQSRVSRPGRAAGFGWRCSP